MTIDEAIKELTPQTDADTTVLTYPETEALKLGIEALKRCQIARKAECIVEYGPLSGETEDKQIADNMRDHWKHQRSHAD